MSGTWAGVTGRLRSARATSQVPAWASACGTGCPQQASWNPGGSTSRGSIQRRNVPKEPGRSCVPSCDTVSEVPEDLFLCVLWAKAGTIPHRFKGRGQRHHHRGEGTETSHVHSAPHVHSLPTLSSPHQNGAS